MAEALTEDWFLRGRVRLLQPAQGYRAATDPVLLAAAVPAGPGQSVLDLGCGAGAAALCLAARVPGLALSGLEIQSEYAALATRNAAANDVGFTVHLGDVAAPPAALKAQTFDHVMTNPPYFDGTASSAADDPGRDRAHRHAAGELAAFLDLALRRLKPRGWLTVIQRAERLAEILEVLAPRAGDLRILPLAARQGRPAKRVIVAARKDSRGPLRLLAPLVLHAGAEHRADRPDFTPAAERILVEVGALEMGGTARRIECDQSN